MLAISGRGRGVKTVFIVNSPDDVLVVKGLDEIPADVEVFNLRLGVAPVSCPLGVRQIDRGVFIGILCEDLQAIVHTSGEVVSDYYNKIESTPDGYMAQRLGYRCRLVWSHVLRKFVELNREEMAGAVG